ncbi:hypothetical protein TRAPUB_9840 [Trametes pubescens]|uniref:Uncharacterized protein n=1 Tax=Trametes pubescens TaxID=154538 RepID=A0A1M2W1C0_TRAPU|nr:hypothetical protein TRAPUB_9840 [Trametes pubescens]
MSLSLRSLSDGKAHGLASEPSIELDAPNDLDLDYQSVLVHGNHALYLNSTRLFYTFTLLNWKTGVSIVERIEIPTEFRPHDVAAFLDDSRVILVGHDVKYLHVYNYYNAPSNTLRKLAEVVTLDIVPPGTTWPIHSISIATSALSTDASFCRLDPRQNFYVISLRVKPSGLDSKDIFIFVPRDLILACAELVNTNQHPLHFGWEEWASGVQIFERNRGRPDPSYGISGARIVLNRILKGNEMKLKFLECDIEEVDSLTCRTVGPPGIVAAGNARGSKSAVSSRIKTRTTRIQLPLPDFLVRSVSPWDFGILIETVRYLQETLQAIALIYTGAQLMDSSIFVASLDGWS